MQVYNIDSKEIIGFIAAILTTAAFVPQVYKTWKTKDVKGISLTMFLVMFTGVILWLIYGYCINSLSMILANSVTVLLIFALIIFRFKYHKE
ncbi:MAG: MtN3 and saliva related transmembrane protein [Mariniflexile sp.]|jgi:MtN3 and saliva related transmembrane protein